MKSMAPTVIEPVYRSDKIGDGKQTPGLGSGGTLMG